MMRRRRRDAYLIARQQENIIRLRKERDNAREEADKQRTRIEDLALEHQPEMLLTYRAASLPVVREEEGPGQWESVFSRDVVEMRCRSKNCPFTWPCPTYLWATGSLPFVVKIERKKTP